MEKIIKYCDAVIESAWLMALIVTPFFFVIDAYHISEPQKIFVFRSIIWFGIVFWIIKLFFLNKYAFSKYGSGWFEFNLTKSIKSIFNIPILISVLFLFLTYSISTVFSISHRTSILGSYPRLDGILTQTTYLLFFMLVFLNLRSREQINRITAVITIVCLGIAGYAILQHFHLDPYSWPAFDSNSRIISTLGHPIFAGAYLCMATFFILPKAIESFLLFLTSIRELSNHQNFDIITKSKQTSKILFIFLKSIIYLFVSIVNILSIWFTVSRGPLLGLISGSLLFFVLILNYFRFKKVLFISLGSGAAFLIFLIILNIPTGPLHIIRDQPILGPLGHIFDAETGSGQTRVLIWQGMAKLTGIHTPISFPDQTIDGFNPIRWLVGYGPDTLGIAYEGFYNPQSYILESPDIIYDRAHNRFWDVFFFYGLIGVISEYGLFLLIFFVSLKKMGFLKNNNLKKYFWVFSLAGGVLGILIPLLANKPEYIGISFHLGLLTGTLIVFVQSIFNPLTPPEPEIRTNYILVIGIFASIISHYIELSTGILTVTSSMLSWCFIAVLFIIDRITEPASIPAISEFKNINIISFREIAFNSIILSSIVVSLGTRFIINFQNRSNPILILSDSLTSIAKPEFQRSYGIFVLLMSCLCIGSLIMWTEKPGDEIQKWRKIFLSICISLITTAFLLYFRACQYIDLNQNNINKSSVSFLITNFNLLTGSIYIYILFFLVTLSVLIHLINIHNEQKSDSSKKTTLSKTKNTSTFIDHFSISTLGILFITTVFYFIFTLNIKPLQSDVLYGNASMLLDSGDLVYAKNFFQTIISLTPDEPVYQRFSGKLYRAIISNTENDDEKELLFTEGLDHLKIANDLEPLMVYNTIALADYYKFGGEIARSSPLRNARFFLAETYYASSLNIKPGRVDYWLEWAGLCASKGDISCALEKIDSAKKMNPNSELIYQFLGDLFSAYADNITDPLQKTEALNRSIKAYQTEADLLIQKQSDPADAYIGMGIVYENLHNSRLARDAYLEAVNHANLSIGSQFDWQLYQRIASLSAELNDLAAEREYLQKAIDSAPENQKAPLLAHLKKILP